MEKIDPQKLYKFQEIGKQGWLGVKEAGVYNLIRKGKLKAMNVSSGKTNKRYVITGAEILRFINENIYRPSK